MFTGIVAATGEIGTLESAGDDFTVSVSAEKLGLGDVKAGDSIAVNGVCLTVTGLDGNTFSADVSAETMRCTALGDRVSGDPVNLEKAMLPTTRFGGHIVSGHVDGVAVLVAMEPAGDSHTLRFEVPSELTRYIARKGSVCIDGVSLTVNEVSGNVFTVNIIPHTYSETIIHSYESGQRINLEVDLIGRYLERLLEEREGGEDGPGGITMDFLRRHGFADAGSGRGK